MAPFFLPDERRRSGRRTALPPLFRFGIAAGAAAVALRMDAAGPQPA